MESIYNGERVRPAEGGLVQRVVVGGFMDTPFRA